MWRARNHEESKYMVTVKSVQFDEISLRVDIRTRGPRLPIS